ncbi:MAG: NAD(P)-dependent oxidoreductase [Verrucomicrobia bacterium]|nr:NAD(P)-dependent oxidoreductase [Verrucomicrobiota bacterium]
MKILVTGGSGFIGTRLTSELVGEGHAVRIFDRRPSSAHVGLWTEGDVRTPEALARAMEGVEAVFHLAAEHRDDVQPASLYTEVNLGGARNLVAAAEKTGCRRVIFTSSVAVYPLGLKNPDEETTPRPFNAYGASKLAAEEVFQDWAARTPGASLTTTRLCVVFGPGNRGNVFNLLDQIQRGRFLMVGSGKNRKSMAYVGNVSRFLVSCLGLPAGIQLLNYADKPDLSVAELVDIANGALGRQPSLRSRLRIPYFLGLMAGYCLDAAALITRSHYPLSSIRIRKFCAETTVATQRLEASGFQRRFSLKQALDEWMLNEFGSSSR